MEKTYYQKLKDPRWQKKRLEVMERDGFKCVACKDIKSTLHVHHSYYDWNKEIWEHDNKSLFTLCDECHSTIHFVLSLKESHWINRNAKLNGINPTILVILNILIIKASDNEKSLFDLINKINDWLD